LLLAVFASVRAGAKVTAKGTKPVVTTFSFTAPTKQGAYTWFCAVPCDPWAMTHLGYMKGRVTVA